MVKFEGKDYEKLSESTKNRHARLLEKIHKSGFSLSDYEKMNDNDFSQNLGIKKGKKTKYGYSNVYSHRKLIRQIKGTSERKKGTIGKSIKKYEKEGWKGKGLSKIRRELVKSTGYTFYEVFEQVDKKYKFKNKEAGYEYTRQLLKIPQIAIQDLNDYDQTVIEGYDTSP